MKNNEQPSAIENVFLVLAEKWERPSNSSIFWTSILLIVRIFLLVISPIICLCIEIVLSGIYVGNYYPKTYRTKLWEYTTALFIIAFIIRILIFYIKRFNAFLDGKNHKH